MEKDFTKQKEAFAELLDIMETLREKCPWDHKQTMESLRTLSVEEVYELGDAILKNDMQESIQSSFAVVVIPSIDV